jgi:hypothetical protein
MTAARMSSSNVRKLTAASWLTSSIAASAVAR